MPDLNNVFQLMDENFKSEGRLGVVKGMDGDKKQAAESLAIEKDTTADAQRVYGDFDNFNKGRKSELAQTLVEEDKWLQEYIKAHPLHSTVSKDDWGKLSAFTDAAKQLVPTESSHFMRGLLSSLAKENPEMLAEFMEGMSYHMPEGLRPTMLSGSKAVRDFAAVPGGYEKTAPDLFNIKNVGDAWAWGAENFGSNLGSMAPSLALGLAGGAAGFSIGGPVGGAAGSLAGMGSVSYAMGYGEVYKALKDEGVDPKQAALLAGIAAAPIAGLDMASMKFITGMFPGVKEAKKEVVRGVARRIAKAVAEGASAEGITESLQEIIKDATVSIGSGKQFGTKEQIKGWIESGASGALTGGAISGGHTALTARKTADKIEQGIDNARPWAAAGQEVPYGVDPIIDQLINTESEERIKILDAIVQNGNKAETKELSAPAWEDLTKIVFGSQVIHIRSDAVRAMYGEEMPTPDDGKLGFIPDIQKQIENSLTTGESIKVKLSDWVGKVDPEINKLLHDDLAFPDKRTINEVKEAPTEAEAVKTTEIPETAFPPLAQELDLPYRLVKGEEGKFDVLDESGDKAAGISITETDAGKNLHVHWENGQIDVAGLRTMMNQLKQMYPNAETITTPKVPGTETLRRDLQGSNITIDMPFRVKETVVDIVRRSAGLEPLFDLPRDGPRAVRLVKNKGQGVFPGDVNFTITDEIGNEVGVVEGAMRRKGKDYYINWIGTPIGSEEGERGLVNKLGPRLVRNLFRQFKTELPGLQTITGFRATGSRERYDRGEVVQINVARLMEEQGNIPAGWERIEGGPKQPETEKLLGLVDGYVKFGPKVWAKRTREWTPEELALEKKITKLLNKIVPQEVRVYGAEDIRVGSGQRRVSGVMQAFNERRPLILWALPDPEGLGTAPHPEGTARHEAVHFLRQYGYITEPEWAILTKHVEDNGLIKKHGIDVRYWYAEKELQIEEAIAEEFRTWEGRGSDPQHIGAKIFQRIREILDAIKSAYREFLGREPTVDDIFRDIDIGRTGARTPGEGPLGKGFGQQPPHRTVDIRAMEQPEPLAMEGPADENAILIDAGFTSSEVRHGVSEEQKAKVRDGWLWLGGSLQRATPEMLAKFKEMAAKDVENKAEDTKKLNHAFAQKPAYPPVSHILGSDWGAGSRGNDPKSFRDAAYRHLDIKYSYNQRLVDKIERALARQPPPYDPGGPVEGEVPTLEPGAIMDKARYAKYQKGINQRNREDTDKEKEDARKEVSRRLTPEWKKNWKEMSADVGQEIANKPDWKVSQFFRNGMFFGMDTSYRPKFDPKFLTPEQRKAFPEQWQQKGGMDPDALAGSFGYSSGSELVDKMSEFERRKGDLGPREFFLKSVKEETDRRMELKYGKLGENILKEAMDHVIGTTQMDLLHEETAALAMKAGQAFPLSKDDMRKNASRRFHDEVAQDVTMRGYFREMYRAGKAAELAFLKGDWVEAFKQKQAQVHLFALAEHAKKFEKVQKKFDDIIKEFNKRDHDPKKIPAEFTEWIHQILFQIKKPPKRLPEDLARLIATRPYKTLGEFADYHNVLPAGAEEYEGDMNPTIVIWDRLMEVDATGMPTWTKGYDDLTVGEVKAVNDSLQSLKFIGRKEGKYLVMGESHVRSQLIGNMDNQLSKLGIKKDIRLDTMLGKAQNALQWMKGGLVQLEAMFDRWDKGNQRGIFTKMFSHPLTYASNALSTAQRKVAQMIKDADKEFGLNRKELKNTVENDVFYDPRFMEEDPDNPGKWRIPPGGQNWMRMTKEHVRGVILNWGNPSNRRRLAEGYYVKPEVIEAWLDKVSDKRDWDWASKIWKIYEHIQKDSDEMTFEMSGTLVEMLPLPSFTNKHGTYDGGYYPIIYDRTKMGGPRLQAEPPPPTVARTYTGWERKRSGSAGPLDLSLTEMGAFMSRRLKDNAFRPVLSEIHKIWADKGFRKSVSKYYGDYAVKMLDNAYNDFAGRTGLTTGVSQAGNQFAEMIRQNTIGALIAFNPGTVFKHGPSAMFQSWGQMGIFKTDFYKSALTMSTPYLRGKNLDFMMKGGKVGTTDWEGSAELQRRHQHWAETIGGAGDIQLRAMNWREQFLYYGSYPVAWSDMVSSTILWKAKYDKTMAELQTWPIEQAHTEAVRLSDYAIRMTHGSTAITSRPEFMRSTNVMTRYLTSLYGFFNHVFNRFYRMAWRTKDLWSDRWNKRITSAEFAKGHGELASDFMMYIVLPSAVEALVVEGLMSQDWDEMGYGELLGKGMIHTVGASVPIVREAVHAVGSGHDPTIGLLGTSAKAYTDLFRQVNPNKEVWDVGKIIQNTATVAGVSTGIGGAQPGRWARFLYDFMQDNQTPETGGDWYRAFRSGNIEPRRGH